MSQKLASMSKLSKGSSLQVMQRDKEWQGKYDGAKMEAQTKISQLEHRLSQMEEERTVTKKNYDSQIRVLSDHIVDLN